MVVALDPRQRQLTDVTGTVSPVAIPCYLALMYPYLHQTYTNSVSPLLPLRTVAHVAIPCDMDLRDVRLATHPRMCQLMDAPDEQRRLWPGAFKQLLCHGVAAVQFHTPLQTAIDEGGSCLRAGCNWGGKEHVGRYKGGSGIM